ncbi:MAG: molecular chaperone TorD family protein [Betaproteobacteria bacterium]|nr:molecular chaperone TorD family protein [Betaproteobacteria bacterium]
MELDTDRLTADRIARLHARSQAYSFLALAFAYPDAAQVSALERQYALAALDSETLADAAAATALIALQPALSDLTVAALERAYTQCFGHAVSKDCPPYEAEYGQAHIFQKAHTLADVAGFYRAFGLDLAADAHERADHVSVELEFMHFLCLKEAYALRQGHPEERLALCREAQRKFLRNHLCRWAFGFARRLRAKAGRTLYRELGQLLAVFLEAELQALGLKPAEVAGPDMIEEGAQALPEAETGRSSCETCYGFGGAQ